MLTGSVWEYVSDSENVPEEGASHLGELLEHAATARAVEAIAAKTARVLLGLEATILAPWYKRRALLPKRE